MNIPCALVVDVSHFTFGVFPNLVKCNQAKHHAYLEKNHAD